MKRQEAASLVRRAVRPVTDRVGGSLRTALFGAFGVICALLVLVTVISLVTQAKLGAATDQIVQVADAKASAAADVRTDIARLEGDQAAYMLASSAGGADGKTGGERERFLDSKRAFDRDLDRLRRLASSGPEELLVGQLQSQLGIIVSADDVVWSAVQQGNRDAAIKASASSRSTFVTMAQTIDDYVASASADKQAAIAAFSTARNTGTAVTLVLGFLALGLAALFAWRITSSISRRVMRTVVVIERVAVGDMSQRVDVRSTDEIGRMGRALNTTLERLGPLFDGISANSTMLAGASEELSAVSQQLAAGANQTADQATVVSSAAEQVSANVHMVAANAEEMSASIREVSTHASTAVQVAAAGAELAASATDTVARLADSSAQIGAIVEVISAIAGQTHLLALNAAIEAARAGEAGESFAVVADEVKQLSRQTAKATQDIAAQVEGIRASAREAADAIGSIVGVIEEINGSQITIAGAVEEQTANTSMIGRSVGEAARGTAEIARSVTGVAEAAQQTTRGAAETQRAAGELARMAAGLRTILAEFSGVAGGPTQP